jgi:hypothetical protein
MYCLVAERNELHFNWFYLITFSSVIVLSDIIWFKVIVSLYDFDIHDKVVVYS